MSKYIKADDAIDIVTRTQGINGDTLHALYDAPSIDLVRCGECLYYENGECKSGTFPLRGDLANVWFMTKPTDFCSYGERRI